MDIYAKDKQIRKRGNTILSYTYLNLSQMATTYSDLVILFFEMKTSSSCRCPSPLSSEGAFSDEGSLVREHWSGGRPQCPPTITCYSYENNILHILLLEENLKTKINTWHICT